MSEFEHAGEALEAKPKRGANVTIRNFWQRHSQKQSGEVFNQEKTGLSLSAISAGGAERATALGKTITAGKHGAKGYRSTSARTQETFDAEMLGYKETNPGVPIREKVRIREQLIAPGNKKFIEIYDKLWSANKAKLLAEGIGAGTYPNVEFGKLTPDQQEEIAEAAEEPVIQEWIDNSKSEMAQAFPPRQAAADFAVLFERRHEAMAKRLNNDSEIDLFHNTHKTATEAFLASGVLVRKSDNKRITKIAELGGSLKILDNWESLYKTNEQGQGKVVITIRGQEYSVDENVLGKLVWEGRKNLEEKK